MAARYSQRPEDEQGLFERLRALEDMQRAMLNILEDFDEEKTRARAVQQATLNILEDFDEQRSRGAQVQQATLNILEDFEGERRNLGDTQRALMNMLEDIEEVRARLEQSRAMLESLNKELESFTYSVSHDLRAPLRAISGFAGAVVEDYGPQLDEEGREFLALIQENAHRMAQLIDDLLAFSRLGRQQVTESHVDMAALAREVFEELTAERAGRSITFTVGPVPPAQGDRALLRQVLLNLLSNAIKFTRTRPRAQIEFDYSSGPDDHAYCVKDNGVGFDMQYADKLFGVFQRLHATEAFEGTGVGLALVSRIITRHGGRVWAHGELDRGATFYFTLPGRRERRGEAT